MKNWFQNKIPPVEFEMELEESDVYLYGKCMFCLQIENNIIF